MTSAVTVDDVRAAQAVIARHISPAPLIRSYRLEQDLGLAPGRRVWLKDYGWTPVGSFKLLGALYWMERHLEHSGDRPVAAHSSGNFAAGIAFAGMRYRKRVIIVMPDTAPQVKLELTRSFGGGLRPRKYGLNCCIPATMKRVDGSSAGGISECDGTRRCPRSS